MAKEMMNGGALRGRLSTRYQSSIWYFVVARRVRGPRADCDPWRTWYSDAQFLKGLSRPISCPLCLDTWCPLRKEPDPQTGFSSTGTPNGIRTRAATLKGWCPRPLDDGGRTLVQLVGLPGFEPGTSSSRTKRATKLRYSPLWDAPRPDHPSASPPGLPEPPRETSRWMG